MHETREFMPAVIQCAQAFGWMVFHPYDSRRSTEGWLDLSMVHPRWARFMIRELKSEKGVLTKPQQNWLAALIHAGIDAAVWRPAQWHDGTIERELRR